MPGGGRSRGGFGLSGGWGRKGGGRGHRRRSECLFWVAGEIDERGLGFDLWLVLTVWFA